MSTWRVLVDGPASDFEAVKRIFTSSNYFFGHEDGKDALSAPVLEFCDDREAAIAAGMELLASINIALRLSVAGYSGLNFYGLIELRPDGTRHRTMPAETAIFSFSGVSVAIAGTIGRRVRNREERLVSLLAKNEAVADLAVLMTSYPLTWGTMYTMYESAKGLMSSRPNVADRRADYQGLIERRWLTEEESNSFYQSATYYRKGYPRIDTKGLPLMEYATASILMKKLFWHVVDELEPI